MKTLTPAERRSLRAKAHHLHPIVTIGQHGLTPAVLHEVDVALRAHELVKIRVFSDDRAEREGFLARICAELDATSVQHLGKLIIVWRPAPEPVAPEPAPAARRKPGKATGTARSATPRADTRKPVGARKPFGTGKSSDPRQPFGARKPVGARMPADARKPAGARKPSDARKPSGVRKPGAPPPAAKARGYAAGARRRRTPR
jgi:putative YhbY family RNA-binding protein